MKKKFNTTFLNKAVRSLQKCIQETPDKTLIIVIDSEDYKIVKSRLYSPDILEQILTCKYLQTVDTFLLTENNETVWINPKDAPLPVFTHTEDYLTESFLEFLSSEGISKTRALDILNSID